MITDELWPGGPSFIRHGDAFRLGTDSVLLADFARVGPKGRVCDLGCGAGVIAVISAWHNPAVTVDGVELLPEWSELARENARLNGLNDRMRILTGDLRDHRNFLEAGVYDLVVSNPPYYPTGSGKLPQNENSVTARSERTCTLRDICAAAKYLTRWGGRVLPSSTSLNGFLISSAHCRKTDWNPNGCDSSSIARPTPRILF